MERIEKAVADAGPLIHLAQINSFDVVGIIKTLVIPPAVFDEICVHDLPGQKEVRTSPFITVKSLEARAKDAAKVLAVEYDLGLGEAEAIALAKQEQIRLFLTDDLAARFVAHRAGLEPHGTVGLVIRAFRGGMVTKERALRIIDDLYKKSSLFLTADLAKYIIQEINKAKG